MKDAGRAIIHALFTVMKARRRIKLTIFKPRIIIYSINYGWRHGNLHATAVCPAGVLGVDGLLIDLNLSLLGADGQELLVDDLVTS